VITRHCDLPRLVDIRSTGRLVNGDNFYYYNLVHKNKHSDNGKLPDWSSCLTTFTVSVNSLNQWQYPNWVVSANVNAFKRLDQHWQVVATSRDYIRFSTANWRNWNP